MSIPESKLVTAITSRSLRTATLPMHGSRSDNYLIDVKFGVIVDVEAFRSIRQAEVGAAKIMIERTEERASASSRSGLSAPRSCQQEPADRGCWITSQVRSPSIHQYH
jgi:hypothetical protein